MGEDDDIGPAWLVVERLEGETIPRKILRDPRVGRRPRRVDRRSAAAPWPPSTPSTPTASTGLPRADPLRDPLPLLDALGEVRPALELGARWLGRAPTRAAVRRVTVHGDFRCGNLLVDPAGLRGVLDWELAHAGDPAEDIGWLCAPAWRFGGPGEVGGFGRSTSCSAAYAAAGGGADRPRPGCTGGRSTPR